MNLLTATNITKGFTDKNLFHQIDFSINEGEKIGLIGINGTGKSTLLKIIAGLEEPDEGTIAKGNKVLVRYLPQNPEFKQGETVLENVLRENRTKDNEWSIESEAKTILTKLGINDFSDDVSHLSGGQRKRIALASTLLAPAEILILDEPTNHLDHEMTEWLEQYLVKMKAALLMVTHDRYFLDRVSNRIAELDKGNLYSYKANYSGFLALKAEREEMEMATERKRQSILRTELAWISRGAKARSTKQKARIERYEQLKEQDGPTVDGQVEMNSISSRLGKTTLELHDISKAYGNKTIMKDFNYIFLRDDKIGIIGPNGCGKTTLLKIMNGIEQPDQGEVVIGQTVKIGYFSQENETMDPSLRVIDYIRNIAEYIKTTDGEVSASQMLERFLFPADLQYNTISRLSGGERRRLYLLSVLMKAPNILILDEPTNDLDITTLAILENYLDQFDGIVITVSHDRYFLDRIVERMFAFEGNGSIRQYEGGYSDYMEVRKEFSPLDDKSQETFDKKPVARVKQQRLKFTYQEQKDFDTIEDTIATLEEKIDDFDKQITQNATNYGKLKELMDIKAKTEQDLEETMERWMYLTDLAKRIKEEKENQ